MSKPQFPSAAESFAYTTYRIASSFASLEDRDTIINQSLALLGEVCGAGRSYLFLFREDGVLMDNTHEWCAPGVSAEIENLRDLPIDIFPWWMEHLRAGEQIHVPDVSKLPPDEAAAEKEILEQQDIQSVLVLPIYREAELGGFLGLDNVQSSGAWAPETREYLRVAAELVSSTLTRDDRARSAEARRKELEHAYEDLKHTQSQLLQSEKLASIGMLAAGVAHEINNPLAYITSNTVSLGEYLGAMREMSDAIDRGVDSADLKEIAARVDLSYLLEDGGEIISANLEGLGKVKDIVTNLMSFARVDPKAQNQVADIRDGIRTTLAIASTMTRYTVDISFQPGEVPTVQCNIGELNQVFLNVLMNAHQAIASHNRDGTGRIAISTFVDEGMIHCLFRDDGPGFDPDTLDRVFEPFFTTKDVGQGTGLGMSICYDIVVNKHGGQIEIGNNPEGGAFVDIKIPINPAPES